ncbi:hypothetical protein [Companilactobacillus nuruki]|uniref:hypothetical protein n=1 Tax=Companilactobacillus nuruki TaxID=1993540 RepID=UPI001416F784|nr:hypothetical protein [Companilactobacillus nuruki]
MSLLKFNSKMLVLALVILVVGAVLMVIALSLLNFDINEILSHFGTWYAPINLH